MNQLTPQQAAEGWLLLWDGESTFGWESMGGAAWKVGGDSLQASSGTDGWLRHNTAFADFVLRLEFRMNTFESDSGVFIRAAKDGDPTKTGYQININNMNNDFGTGSIVNRVKRKATVPAKVWHRYEITAEGDYLTVVLDGKKVVDAREREAAVGYVGLQWVKGADIEFRNVMLRPLGLKSLFNGKDLTGWQRVDRPNVKAPPEWSVREGSIHVEKGPGSLETSDIFGDFVLQIDIRTNAQNENHHPNSGVFFRGDKGGFWTGYESQIRNEYKGGDRAQPVDFGTGGVYNLQPARHVVSDDKEFFTKTIVASGRHIGIWVNGIQTADFDDSRAEGMNARREARLAPGPIALQAHDPTTNLDFRSLRIAALPSR